MDNDKLRADVLRYRTYLTDVITGLPTMALEMERLRKKILEIDWNNYNNLVTLMIMEISDVVEEIAGWAIFDSIMKDIGYMFRTEYEEKTGIMRDVVSIMVPAVRGNQFVFIIVKNDIDNKDKFLDEVSQNLKNSIMDILKNYLKTSSPDMINMGYSHIIYDVRKRFERIIYDAYNKAYMNLFKNKEKDTDRKFTILKTLIDENKIITVYQPIVDVHTRDILGYEALSRVDTSLFPDSESLFSYAIETEYLYDLERLCRKNAILHIVNNLPESKLLFINNSARGIVDSDLVNGTFQELLNLKGIPIDNIVLELTERIAIENYEYYIDILRKLKETGYRIAIDDMGSGYSSMRTLAELKPDFLKYDMNLVRNIHESNIKQELLKALVDVAATIGAKVIAEGVETKEEMDMVVALGADYAQGFYLKKPAKIIEENI